MHIEKKNGVSQTPKVFYARHMQPGIAKYENETILVDTQGVKSLINTGVGIPVYIDHQDVDYKTMKEKAAGYVTESFYNALDGWAWFKFLAVDDAAYDAIKKGWSVSNAYKPAVWGRGGTKNNCKYDREVTGGEFTHLAIVSNPRYENACILTPEEFETYQVDLKKSLPETKNSKGKKMFKLFRTTKEEVSTIDADTVIELTNGKQISVAEMVAVVENSMKEEATVIVNGKKITVSDLAKLYENAKKNAKKNEKGKMQDEEEEDCMNELGEDEEDDEKKILKDKKNKKNAKKNAKSKKNEMDDEDMENEDDGGDGEGEGEETSDAKKHKQNKTKKNSLDGDKETRDYFNELRNANRPLPDAEPLVEVMNDALARGKKRYGSSN